MRTGPTKRDNTRYCEFYRDHGHRMNDCIQLRKEIEYLIRRGYLRRYIASEDQDKAQPPPPWQPTPTQHQKPLGEIHVISGGFAGGGESSSARKAHLRSIKSGEVMEVQAVSKLPRLDTAITFSNSDLEGCQHPHDDPLVIRAIVANKTIHRVLVDNGSSADIIFASAFDLDGHQKGEAGTSRRPPAGILWRESATFGVNTASAHLRRPPGSGNNDSKISHSRCPLNL